MSITGWRRWLAVPQAVFAAVAVVVVALAVVFAVTRGQSSSEQAILGPDQPGAAAGPTGETTATDDTASTDRDTAGGTVDGTILGPPTVDGETQGSDTTSGPTNTAYEGPGIGVLPTDQAGEVVPQTTPPNLIDRQHATVDTLLPPPPESGFELTDEPLEGEPLARSTWADDCPVAATELRYLTVTFWGFDGERHPGELVVHETVADDIATVFETLYEAKFPIEEMRIVTQADLDAPPTGDGNNTATFACRPVTGGSRFSEHAYGLAIDINPFHNPYLRDDVVLPELARSYLDRDNPRPGMILEGDVVVDAFDAIGWGWGGRWSSLKDYQHFALNDR